jgi:hypothetical protein
LVEKHGAHVAQAGGEMSHEPSVVRATVDDSDGVGFRSELGAIETDVVVHGVELATSRESADPKRYVKSDKKP